MKKGKYTPSSAKRWLRRHNFYYGKIDKTKNWYRFRQFEPPRNGKFRTKSVTADIKFIMWYPRGASRHKGAHRNRSRHFRRISKYAYA